MYKGRFEVNLSDLEYNYKIHKKLQNKLACVVKSNAYGFGILKIAETLYDLGQNIFYVRDIFEGVSIRKHLGTRPQIICLQGFWIEQKDLYEKYQIIPMIISLEQLQEAQKISLPLLLMIDTGMNTTGLKIKEIENLNLEHFNILCLNSHFSSSKFDVIDTNQIAQIKYLFEKYKNFPWSLCKTTASFFSKDFPNIARIGHGLYFEYPELQTKNIGKIFGKILKINDLEKGDKISYNGLFQAEKTMKIAIVNFGYHFGINNNHPFVFINQEKCPVLGQICMEVMAVDISNLNQNPKIGDNVDIYGDFSSISDLLNCSRGYLTSNINTLDVERVYKKNTY